MEQTVNAVVVQNIVTKAHEKARHQFLVRIEAMLENEMSIRRYAIDDQSYYDQEQITLVVDDKTELHISLKQNK